MRVLMLSNMRPDASHPERGQFVRDQATELSRIGVDLHLHQFPPGARSLVASLAALAARYRRSRLDVVHAHFSLTAIPATAVPARVHALSLHGTDVCHPRTRQVTRALLPLMDLLVAPSASLAAALPGPKARRRAVVIPCGVDTLRFHPIPRASARSQLGLPAAKPLLLFPADPNRPEKRHDLALSLAKAAGADLLSLGGVDPSRVPLLINAANAVVLPSDREGFGLAVLEALACNVPVLSTPVGIHPTALAGIEGALCQPFSLSSWLTALKPHLEAPDPRLAGRARAEELSAARTAATLLEAWQRTLEAKRAAVKPSWRRSAR